MARKIGKQMGPFDCILTSQIPRTVETALAMGFAVDEQWEALGAIPAEVFEEIGHQERWTWAAPFRTFAEVISRDGATAHMGKHQQALWVKALESVPTNGNVLILSHGRIIEAGLVTCVPDEDFSRWGAPFHHCEGVRMKYHEGRFTDVQLLRIEELHLTRKSC